MPTTNRHADALAGSLGAFALLLIVAFSDQLIGDIWSARWINGSQALTLVFLAGVWPLARWTMVRAGRHRADT